MQALVGLAIFVLAVNLAYLRFETFEHRRRIEKRASEKLGAVDVVPDELKETDYFKRLSSWAGKSQDKKLVLRQLGWLSRWYPWLFDKQRDRQVAKCMIYIVMPVVVFGTGHISELFKIPAQDTWIFWLWLVLVMMTVGSVIVVLAGNHYVAKAFELIDDDADQWKIFMRNQTPGVEAKHPPHLDVPAP